MNDAVLTGSEMKQLSMYVAVLILLTMSSAIPKTRVESDESTVAKLDTEYQAAVKRNDAATMARILADDFVLVTGKGHIYTKADLLKDANGMSFTNARKIPIKRFASGATQR